jgi:hypothetical protein
MIRVVSSVRQPLMAPLIVPVDNWETAVDVMVMRTTKVMVPDCSNDVIADILMRKSPLVA